MSKCSRSLVVLISKASQLQGNQVGRPLEPGQPPANPMLLLGCGHSQRSGNRTSLTLSESKAMPKLNPSSCIPSISTTRNTITYGGILATREEALQASKSSKLRQELVVRHSISWEPLLQCQNGKYVRPDGLPMTGWRHSWRQCRFSGRSQQPQICHLSGCV
jgi:hypothetical protein